MFAHDTSISASRRWLETLTITMLSPWFGFWANHSDPFLIHAKFPWLVLVPLLVGTQHGMRLALASACLLGGRAYLHAQHDPAGVSVTLHWLIGCVLVGGIAGYCRDRSLRSFESLQRRAIELREQLQRAPAVRHVIEAWPTQPAAREPSAVPSEPAAVASHEALSPIADTSVRNVTMIGFNRRAGERRARRQ